MCKLSNDPPRDLLVTRYTKKFPHDLFSCSSNYKVLSPFLLCSYFGPLQQKFSIGCYLSNYFTINNTLLLLKHDLAQENIGDNVKHEKVVSNKLTLYVCLLRFAKVKDNFPALCILAQNAILNIENYCMYAKFRSCFNDIFPFFFLLLTSESDYSCPPGWHSLDESCFQLNKNLLKSRASSQQECHQRGGRLAMFESTLTTQYLTGFLEDYMEYLGRFYIGARAVPTGHFITIEYKPFSRNSSLWGPGEPSGDGLCSDMLFKQEWEGRWRVNDESCIKRAGFVCQKKMTISAGKETAKF